MLVLRILAAWVDLSIITVMIWAYTHWRNG